VEELLILGGRVHAVGVEAIGAAVIGIGAVSTVFLFARSLLAPYE
jgi:hypothetical protein